MGVHVKHGSRRGLLRLSSKIISFVLPSNLAARLKHSASRWGNMRPKMQPCQNTRARERIRYSHFDIPINDEILGDVCSRTKMEFVRGDLSVGRDA